MQLIFLLFISFALCANSFEITPSSAEEIASLNSNLLIEGFVSPLSGQVSINETDLVVHSAQDIQLMRNYVPPRVMGKYSSNEKEDHFHLAKDLLSQPARNWLQLPHLLAGYNINSPHFQIRDPAGFVLEFSIHENKGILKTDSLGMSNLNGDKPSASADLRNIELILESDSAHITWPDGTKRIYRKWSPLIYRLEKELLPNGKALQYTYHLPGLAKITATNHSGTVPYASIQRVNAHHYLGSDGRETRFEYTSMKVDGKIKKKHQTSEINFFILSKAQNPIYSNTIGYNNRTLLSSYDAKNYPVQFDYSQEKDREARVTTLSTPSGSTQISYDPPQTGKKKGSTTVRFPNGATRIYRFNEQLLLTAIENWLDHTLINSKTFSYDQKQHVQCIETRDGSGTLLIGKSYECDQFGNPVVEKIYGDFGSTTIRRSFSKNRLLKEEREEGWGIEYTYLDDTHLLTSKILLDHGTPLRTTTYHYDDCCNLIEETEKGRTKTSYSLYETGPHLHRVKEKTKCDWNGNLLERIVYAYDSWGNLSEEQHFGSDNRTSYTLRKTYNAKGELLEETNPLGQTAIYEYDARGRCIYEVPFSQQLVLERTFDPKGRLTTLKEGSHTTLFSYNATDDLIEKRDYLGLVTRMTYHPVHHKPICVEAAPTVVHSTLDAFGREIQHVNAEGATTKKRYNGYGDLIEVINPDGGKEQFSYTPAGRLSVHQDADGLRTSYEYDALGRTLSKKIGEHLTTYKYDAHHLREESDPLGIVTAWRYDLAGRKIEENRAGRTTSFTYDPFGFLASETRGHRSITYTRDALGRLLTKSLDGVFETTRTYDSLGNIATLARGGNQTSFTYDPYSRLIAKIDPEGNRTSVDYQEGDRILIKRTQDARGVITQETYNAHGLLTKRQIGDQTLEEFAYDAALRLISQDHLTFTYTPAGKRASCTEAGVRSTTWSYTAGGKVLTKQKPDGSLLTHRYDAQGRLAGIEDRQFCYDALDRLISGSHFSRRLDAFGNILHEEWNTGLWIESSYDDWDRPLEQRLCDRSRIVYEYEGPFMKKISRIGADGALLYTHTYHERNAAGNVLSESGLFPTVATYDKRSAKTSQTNPYFQEEIAYDAAGNVIQRGSVLYSYDQASQMTAETGKFTARYDAHRNCIEKNDRAIVIDSLNQRQDLAYDANGNIVRAGFVYDLFDQLVEANGERSVYDSLGRRILKGETAYLYDSDEEIASFEKGACKELKVVGDQGIVAVEIDSKPFAPIQDVQETIRLLVDWKTGEVAHRNECDSFGVGLTGSVPYAYAGKRFDAATGLVYFGQRFYDPNLGRWLTRDPLWEIDHSNLYQYVLNNPFSYRDPRGESLRGYLIGIGEIALGVAVMAVGVTFALPTGGTSLFVVSFGLASSTTGMALIGDGLTRTTTEARDISFDRSFPRRTNTASEHDSSYFEKRGNKDKKNGKRHSSDEPGSPPYRGDELGDDPAKKTRKRF